MRESVLRGALSGRESDVAAWDAFEKARGVLAAGFSNSKPAARYRA